MKLGFKHLSTNYSASPRKGTCDLVIPNAIQFSLTLPKLNSQGLRTSSLDPPLYQHFEDTPSLRGKVHRVLMRTPNREPQEYSRNIIEYNDLGRYIPVVFPLHSWGHVFGVPSKVPLRIMFGESPPRPPSPLSKHQRSANILRVLVQLLYKLQQKAYKSPMILIGSSFWELGVTKNL